jgi:hypothetical protein
MENSTQLGFSRLWDDYETDKEAMIARNKKAKELQIEGFKVRCWTLRNQIKPYNGIGQPNGLSCNIYMIDIAD